MASCSLNGVVENGNTQAMSAVCVYVTMFALILSTLVLSISVLSIFILSIFRREIRDLYPNKYIQVSPDLLLTGLLCKCYLL